MEPFAAAALTTAVVGAGAALAAGVVNRARLESNPNNHLLMHAMGPNEAGVIGSAVAAAFLLSLLG